MARPITHPIYRLAFAAALAAICALASASGPENQYGYKTPIVRIGIGNAFQGTGTVIDNQKVAGVNGAPDQGYFCILTADHVVAAGPNGAVRNNLTVGFGKLHDVSQTLFPNNGNYMANATVTARQGIDAAHPNEMVDMAIVKVPYGVYNAAYDMYAMAISPFDAKVGDAFSSAGYGNQGARLIEANAGAGGILQPDGKYWNGYIGNKKYEEQHSYYNSVNAIILKNEWDDPPGATYNPYDPSDPYAPQDDDPSGYNYEAMVYDNTSPLSLNAIVDEGVSFNGDSGAPYMAWDGFQNTIIGIHTYGLYLAGVADRVKPWGFPAGGVHLNNQYRGWIMTECAKPVPEPGTLVVGLVGLVGLRLRRRKAR